jgi:Flp pilus assembly protein TadG
MIMKLRRGRRGQALLMVTMALFAMGGLLGLAVDLGWSYFVKKSAQSAADSAALGAAYQALATIGNGTYPSTYAYTNTQCPASADTNLSNGCLYAAQAGFTAGGHGGRQNVTMESGVGTNPLDCSATLPALTAPCFPATNLPQYWVTARVAENIPQLFSTMLGNSNGIASARATAAIVPVVVNGALWTLDRANDPGNPNGKGIDVVMKGGDQITAPAGLIVASTDTNGISTNGNTTINAPITVMSPGPNPNAGGSNTFQDLPEGQQFLDPFAGLGQPPLPGTALQTYGVPGGNFANGVFPVSSGGTVGNQVTGNLPPGNYIPILCNHSSTCSATMTATADTNAGAITVGSNTTLSFPSTFGTYIFYGGLDVAGTMNVGPGQFVVAGAMTVEKNAAITDQNSGTDAGQMFILTGSSSKTFSASNNSDTNLYPGLMTELNSNPLIMNLATAGNLAFGPLTTQTGLGNRDSVDPSGINPGGPTNPNGIPSNLLPFAGVVFWQDQANTNIKYTSNGNIDASCGGIDTPCTNSYNTSSSSHMDLQAQGTFGMKGIMYQPRGASVSIGGHGNGKQNGGGITGALMFITGSVEMNGGGVINLTNPPIPLTIKVASLIE